MATLNRQHSQTKPGPNQAERRPRRYARLAEAAEYLGVTDRTVRQMIADGRLTGYRSGTRLVRVDLNEIDDAMQPFGGAA
jgi:excisionase family DNA binding protein